MGEQNPAKQQLEFWHKDNYKDLNRIDGFGERQQYLHVFKIPMFQEGGCKKT